MGSANKGKRDMAEHKHGEMNTDVQEKTFEGFIKAVTWSVVVIVGLLLFIAAVNG
ncbi:aa3 type cytochrome c oxidase subunit IV [Roseovarius tolerans]|uniref:Aa3 type cytochrome c oxidase subunit IV n=1 Tax=Roseovarius tolerans TaxID=74031 RepID=A0A1H8JS71_9RHOB|nr:aa3 type cytochrome c oxidase subunit IV [Roseovarius tolerans]